MRPFSLANNRSTVRMVVIGFLIFDLIRLKSAHRILSSQSGYWYFETQSPPGGGIGGLFFTLVGIGIGIGIGIGEGALLEASPCILLAMLGACSEHVFWVFQRTSAAFFAFC